MLAWVGVPGGSESHANFGKEKSFGVKDYMYAERCIEVVSGFKWSCHELMNRLRMRSTLATGIELLVALLSELPVYDCGTLFHNLQGIAV